MEADADNIQLQISRGPQHRRCIIARLAAVLVAQLAARRGVIRPDAQQQICNEGWTILTGARPMLTRCN